MSQQLDAILQEVKTRTALWAAWRDSQPGASGGHEEGGFVISDPSGTQRTVRWPKGQLNRIVLPPHTGCRIGGNDIILTFHTHPNTGPLFFQEPSQTDIRAVRDDPDLK